MSIIGLDHVQVAITAGGEAAARDFYGQVLGLREIRKPATLGARGGVWFACGAQELHCGVEGPVSPSRRHPALLTDDLDAMRARLEAAGFPIRTGAELPGYRRFYTEDPFGNRLECMERIEEPKGWEGSLTTGGRHNRQMGNQADPGGPEPVKSGGEKTLAYQKRHIARTHKRWLAALDATPPRDQCGACRYWVPLTEPWGWDWGACTNPKSDRDGRVQFEHDGCEAFEQAERWTLPRPVARDQHLSRPTPPREHGETAGPA